MRENQRIAVTRRMLQEGLLRLLRTRELQSIRIIELCRESGINRATFYRHYTNPQDVLLELERETARTLFPEEDPTLEDLCRQVRSQAQTLGLLMRCGAEATLTRQALGYFRRQIRQLPEAGSCENITAFLCGGGYHLLRRWVLEDTPQSPEEIAALLGSLLRWPGHIPEEAPV